MTDAVEPASAHEASAPIEVIGGQAVPGTVAGVRAALPAVLKATEPALVGKLREVAHSSIAVLGALSFLQALAVDAVATYGGFIAQHGVTIPLGVSNGLGLAGGALVAASKFIDSANNALK